MNLELKDSYTGIINMFSGEQHKAIQEMETHDILEIELSSLDITILKVVNGYIYMIDGIHTFVPEISNKLKPKRDVSNT